LTYRGVFYDKLFYYPKSKTPSYDYCEEFLDELPLLPTSPYDPELQLAVHTCFEPCRKPADCLIGFDDDNRPICTPENRKQGLYCVHPDSICEQYIELG